MSAIADRIDHVISLGLGPALKRAGYSKRGRTFRRKAPGCVQVVNVQGTWMNHRKEGTFTVNLGVYFPQVAEVEDLFRRTEAPSESDCIVGRRIGQLMPGGLDHWWRVSPSTDDASIAAELESAWQRYGSPWIEAHSDLRRARGFLLESNGAYWGAVFSIILGERDEAARLLREAIAGAGADDVVERLRSWGMRHGLLEEAKR